MVDLFGIHKIKPNFNANLGIPFTFFSCNKLDPEVVIELQEKGDDINYNSALMDASIKAERLVEQGVFEDFDDAYEDAMSELEDWYDDEPVHYGVSFHEKGDIVYRTVWLGGALLLCIEQSPLRGTFAACSPCLPGALDGDTPGDYEGFDIPEDWKRKE